MAQRQRHSRQNAPADADFRPVIYLPELLLLIADKLKTVHRFIALRTLETQTGDTTG